jgi:hypothetical protein
MERIELYELDLDKILYGRNFKDIVGTFEKGFFKRTVLYCTKGLCI